MGKHIRLLLIIIFSITIFLSSYMIFKELQNNKKQQATYENLENVIKVPGEKSQRDIGPLFSKNPDFIGWINIQGTKLDYPLMHTPQQGEKYLRLDFYKKYSSHGVPFLDGRANLDSDNLIIYGHNMKDGTMFAPMKKFLDPDFLKDHSFIEFQVREETRHYEIFALVTVDKYHPWYNFILIGNQEDYQKLISNILKENHLETQSYLGKNEKFLTLSTCYGKDRDGRMLIIAREIK